MRFCGPKKLDYSTLFFNSRSAVVYDRPFFHGCIDNYLPDALYQGVLGAFPKETLRINYSGNATLGGANARWRELCLRIPGCEALLNFFTSDSFLEDMRKFITPALARELGACDQRAWQYVSGWSDSVGSDDAKPIKVTFKFSRLRRGEWVPPHTDNPCKLFSILLYFADAEWRDDYRGGTEIYEPKVGFLKNNWRGLEAPFEWMNRARAFAFVPNRLVFFINSKYSWHGVSPLACPEGRSRKSLLITLHDRVYQKETALHSMARGGVRSWMRLKGYG